MPLTLEDCTFFGPALPEPFVKLELETKLSKKGLLTKASGPEGKKLQSQWDTFRARLRRLGAAGGSQRVFNQVLEPLAAPLGYAHVERAEGVRTREGVEDGGWLLSAAGAKLRVFAVDVDTDLDAPSRRGHAYRFSPSRVAQRVLLAANERVGVLTDGEELRILLCDPARPDSHVAVHLGVHGGWRGARQVPDSFRLLIALCQPSGVAAVPELTEDARLSQTKVTDELRLQARSAVTGFLQGILDEPRNAHALAEIEDKNALASELWREGLIMVYRLLFVFKLEASSDPARVFSFASTSLWRNTYSPNTALGRHARAVLHDGAETGTLLEGGLRTLFRMFAAGLESAELKVSPLGGALFGPDSTSLLDTLRWGERAVALLLEQLLWTLGGTGGGRQGARQRVHYGSLDVEDLGRVYEALLELEPGIASEPMLRLRRDKVELVVSATEYVPIHAHKSEVVEEIESGKFYLRAGLGRKSTGSYYTPHPFVRFLVRETLAPQIAERSPTTDPRPDLILALNVLDPAMGSGHFLVEACRFLGEQLYEACRLCDELALAQEEKAARSKTEASANVALARATELRKRVEDLPDPNDELLAYLPSRAPEGETGGLSQVKALALCRRLVAVHCLYGVDKNPLAVELAKLSLWLESYAEGLPLTFLDHRLVCGDSLTGPSFRDLWTYPGTGEPVEELLAAGLEENLRQRLHSAISEVHALESSIGKDVAELQHKQSARTRLEAALEPFNLLARAWSGGVTLGANSAENGACDDGAYLALARAVAAGQTTDALLERTSLRRMVDVGSAAVSYDLQFPEVFHARGDGTHGFDAVIGNPPWDKPHVERSEFGKNSAGHDAQAWKTEFKAYEEGMTRLAAWVERHVREMERFTGSKAVGHRDVYFAFSWRFFLLANEAGGALGLVLGGGLAKNPAARSLRGLFLTRTRCSTIVQYENEHRLFGDLPPVVEFCLVAARRMPLAPSVRLATRQRTFQDLDGNGVELRISDILSRWSSGDQLSLLSLANAATNGETAVARQGSGEVSIWELICRSVGSPVQEANSSSHVALLRLSDRLPAPIPDVRCTAAGDKLRKDGVVPLLSGRSVQDYDGLPRNRSGSWDPKPTHAIDLSKCPASMVERLRHFRLVFRRNCGSPQTNERSLRAAVIPPGLACSENLLVEKEPWKHTNASRLALLALLNAFVLDGRLRPKIQTKIGKSILEDTFTPTVKDEARFLAHSALRLSCTDAVFAPLWKEQLGSEWRESTQSRSWPAIADIAERWSVRAAIDAVVANVCGLSRGQYAELLSAFMHRSYPDSPAICLSAFDRLEEVGMNRFCKQNDPYWDIPLTDAFPAPVIRLPHGSGAAGGKDDSPRARSARSSKRAAFEAEE